MDEILTHINISKIIIEEMLNSDNWYNWKDVVKASLKDLNILENMVKRAMEKPLYDAKALPIPDVSKSACQHKQWYGNDDNKIRCADCHEEG